MAEEVQKKAPEAVDEVVVLLPEDVPQAEKTSVENKQDLSEAAEAVKPTEEAKECDQDSKTSSGEDEKVGHSFKEETTKVADLPDAQKKAIEELKQLVKEALNKHEFFGAIDNAAAPTSPYEEKEGEKEVPAAVEDVKKPAEEQPYEVVSDGSKKDEEESAKIKAEPEVVAESKDETEKVAASDDDGAKTVEAIEETIVPVCPSVPAENTSTTPKEPEDKASDQPSEAETKADSLVLPVSPEEVSIWGIPLLADETSDVILLKFLRARDFKVKDAFNMIKNTIRWRKAFGIDELLEEDFGDDLEKVVFMDGFDKEGHPICYNVYGEFQDKELYQKTFSDEEKRQKFLRWRIQFLEKSIRKLDFTPGGISSMVQVNDLKNSPGPGKWELKQATKQALELFQDNYPEFVAKQVFINVPWWYLAVNRMISPFLTQRTKSKFVFAGPSKSAETLFRYIDAQQVPVKYGGLSKDGEFGTTDAVTEVTVKPAAKHTVEFPVNEACLLTWEVRVVGWDVSYGAEFVPNAEESYTVIIQKNKKICSTEEPVICNSFKIGEPGKVVLTINNTTSRKKKLLYRSKTKPSSD